MKKAWNYNNGQLKQYLKKYHYQPELTTKLDGVTEDFDQNTIQEIVLWKVNRYPQLDPNTIRLLNELTTLRQGEHRQGETVLNLLLAKESKGIDLPMASTILRFRNPAVFQIIDRRAYRALTPDKDRYSIYPTTPPSAKIELYFQYLDQMLEFCQSKSINFSEADRILYQFDIDENKEVRLNGKQKTAASNPREGWEEQFQQMHENGDDKLLDSDV